MCYFSAALYQGMHKGCAKMISAKKLPGNSERFILSWLEAGRQLPDREDSKTHLAQLKPQSVRCAKYMSESLNSCVFLTWWSFSCPFHSMPMRLGWALFLEQVQEFEIEICSCWRMLARNKLSRWPSWTWDSETILYIFILYLLFYIYMVSLWIISCFLR